MTAEFAAVTIWDCDERGILAVDLLNLLQLAGPKALTSRWSCSGVESLGPGADTLHAVSDGPEVLGTDLFTMAEDVDQVINGEFSATPARGSRPWLVIRAIESTEYAVVTDDDDLLRRVRARYRDVRDSPRDLEGM